MQTTTYVLRGGCGHTIDHVTVEHAGQASVAMAEAHGIVVNSWHRGDCPTCGKFYNRMYRKINGRFSEKRICNDRCTTATGFDCTCNCGGTNHGRD
jgi:hypothetical protein